MNWKKIYPPSEGWLRMELTLKSKRPLSEAHIQRIVSFGKPETYEFGEITQHGAKVVAHLRSIRPKAAQPETRNSQPETQEAR